MTTVLHGSSGFVQLYISTACSSTTLRIGEIHRAVISLALVGAAQAKGPGGGMGNAAGMSSGGAQGRQANSQSGGQGVGQASSQGDQRATQTQTRDPGTTVTPAPIHDRQQIHTPTVGSMVPTSSN
jgi:hypothetical protein